jgi:hypothetical protein
MMFYSTFTATRLVVLIIVFKTTYEFLVTVEQSPAVRLQERDTDNNPSLSLPESFGPERGSSIVSISPRNTNIEPIGLTRV